MMTKSVAFYFDYVSPYSYLAQTQLPKICEKTGATIEYVPMLLGALHKAVENKSPAFLPAKAKWIFQDCVTWAQHYNLPIKWHPKFPFNTIPLLRATIWLQQTSPEKVANFVELTFRALWEEGLDVTNPLAMSEHFVRCGVDVEALQAGVQQESVKGTLKNNMDQAVEKGFFGAPGFIVDGRVFFGQDRLQFVEAALDGTLPPLDLGAPL